LNEATQKINNAIDEYNTSLGDLKFITTMEIGTTVQVISTRMSDFSQKIDVIGNQFSLDFFMEANVKALRYKPLENR
jgi:hypothetical protein